MNLRQAFFFAAVGAACAGLAYNLLRFPSDGLGAGALKASPHYTASAVDLQRFNRQGELIIQGHAVTVQYFDDGSIHAEHLQVTTLGTHASPWHMTAAAADMAGRDSPINLTGPVDANSRWPDTQEALHLQTPRLQIDPGAHRILTDARVDLLGTSRSANAKGMRADFAGHTVQLLNDVHMTYVVPPAS
jgi:LPS export ABC transporter protein LptC